MPDQDLKTPAPKAEASAPCDVGERQLWSWIDRGADELDSHVAHCPQCRARAAELHDDIAAIEAEAGLALPPPPTSIGPFQIVRLLGEGGQGLVYEARQKSPDRPVALKVLRCGRFVDTQDLRLFQREVRTLARLRHPNIAAIHQAGTTEEGQHYFVMERVDGVPLNEYARARGLGIRARLSLFRSICLAIHYAHQRGVIHRDLKPTNILVDASGHAKILDFGLARLVDEDLGVDRTVTRSGRVQGTLPYMSPEQAAGRTDELDVRCDVYALGVLLYELLTGRLPFEVASMAPHEAVRVVCEEPSPRPGSIVRALRGDLETIILKAIAKEPEQRYQSAIELADDVERYLTGQAILARAPSAVYQLQKLVSRHKLPFALTTTLFVLAAATAVWVSILYAQSSHEADKSHHVNQFLQKMLESYNPYEAPGRTKTVYQLLDDASDRLRRDRTMPPEIEAAVRETLGQIYLSLGRYSEAESHLWAVLQIRLELLGSDHPDVVRSKQHLATLLQAKGDFAGAEAMFREVCAARRAREGEYGTAYADSLEGLAEVLTDKGKFSEAESLLRTALRLRRAGVGEQSAPVAESLNSLAIVLCETDQLAESEHRFDQAMQMRCKLLGNEHPFVADTLSDRARLLIRQGQIDVAESNLLEALDMRRATLPPQHPDVADSLVALARVQIMKGEPVDAMQAADQALQIRKAVFPTEHWKIAEARYVRGLCLLAQGRYSEAEAPLLEGYRILRDAYGDGHWRCQEVLTTIVELYEALGSADQAALYRQKLTVP